MERDFIVVSYTSLRSIYAVTVHVNGICDVQITRDVTHAKLYYTAKSIFCKNINGQRL